MESFQGEIVKDSEGREAVRFTTASGVRAVVCTSIPMGALEKMMRKLERKLKRAGLTVGASSTQRSTPR